MKLRDVVRVSVLIGMLAFAGSPAVIADESATENDGGSAPVETAPPEDSAEGAEGDEEPQQDQ